MRLKSPTTDDCCALMLFKKRRSLIDPPFGENTVSIEKLDEAKRGMVDLQSLVTLMATTRSIHGPRRIKPDDSGPQFGCAIRAAVRRSGIGVNDGRLQRE